MKLRLGLMMERVEGEDEGQVEVEVVECGR